MSRRRVVILGSTGSVGKSAVKVVDSLAEQLELVGLAAHSDEQAVAEQARQFGVKHVCLYDEGAASRLRRRLGTEVQVSDGADGLIELACMSEADVVLIAIVGTAGLQPALAAIEAGKDIAVASKEILVMAGELVMRAAAEAGVKVLPVDSEHNAIFQCLEGRKVADAEVDKLILTASGGPFRDLPAGDFAGVTVERALRHPTWQMGRKISIDSATMFNKALEMIEAQWLFGVPMERVEVLVHPQSIVHSMVEFVDGSVLAQLGNSDMCLPIQYALTWPRRYSCPVERLNLAAMGALEFEAPRADVFPALRLAREAAEGGGTLPAVMNAANEVAVEAFCGGRLGFDRIPLVVEASMRAHRVDNNGELAAYLQADQWARGEAARQVAQHGA